MTVLQNPKAALRAMFDTAVAVAHPREFIPQHLPEKPKGRMIVIGAGKASAAMGAAFESAWDGPLEGLIVTRYGHSVPCQHIEIMEAAHPVPDANGAIAARRLTDIANDATAEDTIVALISGGGSALLSLLPAGCSDTDRAALNKTLLSSGASIDEMNCIRRHVSQISGGRLAAAAYPAKVLCLMISDVPGDQPVDIASGPTVGDPTTLADARAIVAKYAMDLPRAVIDALNADANETIKPDDPRLMGVENRVVAAPAQSLAAAAKLGESLGCNVINLGDQLEGEARMEGHKMAALARSHQQSLSADDAPILLLSGGETTVTLPSDTSDLGHGGRNVDFLLGMMEGLKGAPGIWALACDTDGIDGAQEVAGATFGPEDWPIAEPLLPNAMARFDGHGFFAKLGAQVITGPTLTNVNDFRAVLIGGR